jgi:hypothetical protein
VDIDGILRIFLVFKNFQWFAAQGTKLISYFFKIGGEAQTAQ